MSDVQHEAYRPLIEDGRGIFPEDFRLRRRDAVRAAAQRQHMSLAEYEHQTPRPTGQRSGANMAHGRR